jgi:hypothetical protein
MDNHKWYGAYKKRRHIICRQSKMIYEIVQYKPQERLICIKTTRKFKFHAKWATVQHLKKRFALLDDTTMQVLYGKAQADS